MKILLVEDNALTRCMIKDLLIKFGHEITAEVENGNEVVKYFTEHKPDVVFLDIILPGKSGMEVLTDLQSLDPKTRIVVITAVDQEELNRQLSGKGIYAILHKPFSFDDFKAVMESLAGTSEAGI